LYILFCLLQMKTKPPKPSAVEEIVDGVARHFNAIRVDKNKWAFPKNQETLLRIKENYEIARVLKAFDEALPESLTQLENDTERRVVKKMKQTKFDIGVDKYKVRWIRADHIESRLDYLLTSIKSGE